MKSFDAEQACRKLGVLLGNWKGTVLGMELLLGAMEGIVLGMKSEHSRFLPCTTKLSKQHVDAFGSKGIVPQQSGPAAFVAGLQNLKVPH